MSEIENDTDEPQELSLREKAATLDRPKREPVLDECYTQDGDRRIMPDDDGLTRLPDPPKYRNEREAAESLQQEREDAQEQRAETEIADAAEFERDWKDHQSRQGGWNSDEEKAAVAEYTERHKRHQQVKAVLAQQLPAMAKARASQFEALKAEGRHAEAQALANLHARELAQANQYLAEEDAWIEKRAGEGWTHQRRKQQQVGQHELLRIAPGLADYNTREAFMDWLGKEHGVPRSHAEREQNPQMIARYYRQYEKHEQEVYRQLARKKIASAIPTTRRMGGGSPLTSSADARKALREGGKPSDALELLALQKLEKRYGL